MASQSDIEQLVRMTLPQLERVVAGRLVNIGKTHLEINDIIHTAFILLWERGLEFNFKNMKKPIMDAITQYRFNNAPSVTAALMNETDKQCKRCTGVFPVGMFYTDKVFPNGLIIYHNKCKVCFDLVNEKQKTKRMENEEYRVSFIAKRNEKARIKAAEKYIPVKTNRPSKEKRIPYKKKPIVCISIDGTKQIFDSIKQAVSISKISRLAIHRCLIGLTDSTSRSKNVRKFKGRLKWQYAAI